MDVEEVQKKIQLLKDEIIKLRNLAERLRQEIKDVSQERDRALNERLSLQWALDNEHLTVSIINLEIVTLHSMLTDIFHRDSGFLVNKLACINAEPDEPTAEMIEFAHLLSARNDLSAIYDLLSLLKCIQQVQAQALCERIDEVNILNQSVARLHQELSDTKSSLLEKYGELATIVAKKVMMTDTEDEEVEFYEVSELEILEEGKKVVGEKEEAAAAASFRETKFYEVSELVLLEEGKKVVGEKEEAAAAASFPETEVQAESVGVKELTEQFHKMSKYFKFLYGKLLEILEEGKKVVGEKEEAAAAASFPETEVQVESVGVKEPTEQFHKMSKYFKFLYGKLLEILKEGKKVVGEKEAAAAGASFPETEVQVESVGVKELTEQQPPSYEDAGDDSIFPITPTSFVPRRTDGFGEAVSSQQVPTGRFIFSDMNPPTARAGVAQVASKGMDMKQLEKSGIGQSVPTTPLQVSSQGELGTGEMSSEVGQNVGGSDSSEQTRPEHQAEGGPSSIPSVMVTHATEEAAAAPETDE